MRAIQLSLLAGAAVCLASGAAPAATVARFDGGNSGAVVDAYPGAAGDGWATPWDHVGTGAPTVSTANPLDGAGDPYLSMAQTGTARMVRRRFEDAGRLDVNRQHTLTWTWRFDGDAGDFAGSFNDRFHFFADTDPESGSNAGNSWLVGIIAADRTGNDIHDGHWYFYDRTDGGFNKNNMFDTGMTLTPSATYRFEVSVDPAYGKYDATISDGTTAVTSARMVFRNNHTAADGTFWDYLHVGANASSASDDLTASLDSVRISKSAIQGDFTHGNGTTAADQYTGVAGHGWLGSWQAKHTANPTVAAGVVSPGDAGFSEVAAGAGRYLAASVDNPGDNNGYGAVSREYSRYSMVETTEPHTVHFRLRVDEASFATFVNPTWDQYFVFDGEDSESGYAKGSGEPRTDASWILVAPADDWGGAEAKKWAFYDGGRDGAYFDPSRLVDSGLTIAPGKVFDFAVRVDPAAGTYDVAVSDGTQGAVMQGLGFQRADGAVGRWLHFGGRSNRVEDHRDLSVDLIRIDTPVRRIVADFSDGQGADYVDQYGGRAGNGWVTPWTIKGSSATSGLSGQVLSTDPLTPQGGAYLSATFQRINSGGQACFNRMYSGEIDPTQWQQIRFKYRHDSPVADMGPGDRVNIFESSQAANGTSGPERWLIMAEGGPKGDVPAHNWLFYDGAGSGGTQYVDTGIALVEGHLYDFQIDMDPAQGLWDGWIRDETAAMAFSASGLSFRTSARTAGGYLNFGGVIDAGEMMRFSLDGIAIQAIPEPATAAALAAAAGALGAYVRRRRRR